MSKKIIVHISKLGLEDLIKFGFVEAFTDNNIEIDIFADNEKVM